MDPTFACFLSGRVFKIWQSFRTALKDPPIHLNRYAERIEKPVQKIGPSLKSHKHFSYIRIPYTKICAKGTSWRKFYQWSCIGSVVERAIEYSPKKGIFLFLWSNNFITFPTAFVFLSPPVPLHGGLLCIAFRLYGCHWTKSTRKKFISPKLLALGSWNFSNLILAIFHFSSWTAIGSP